jgi:hypothetical protein
MKPGRLKTSKVQHNGLGLRAPTSLAVSYPYAESFPESLRKTPQNRIKPFKDT